MFLSHTTLIGAILCLRIAECRLHLEATSPVLSPTSVPRIYPCPCICGRGYAKDADSLSFISSIGTDTEWEYEGAAHGELHQSI